MEPAWNRIRSRNSFAWKKNSVLLPIRSGQRHHRSVYFLIGFLSSFDLLFSILCNFSTSSEASTIEGDAGFEEKTKKKKLSAQIVREEQSEYFHFHFQFDGQILLAHSTRRAEYNYTSKSCLISFRFLVLYLLGAPLRQITLSIFL